MNFKVAHRMFAYLATAGLVLPVFTGCSGPEKEKPAPPPEVRTAQTLVSQALTAVKLARVTESVELTEDNFKTSAASARIWTDYTKPWPVADIVAGSGATTVRTLFLAPTLTYLQSAGTTTWLKLEPTNPAAAAGIKAVSSYSSYRDPVLALGLTPTLATKAGFTKVGTATINNIETTRWKAELALAKLSTATPTPTTSATAKPQYLEIWLSDKNFPVRICRYENGYYKGFDLKPAEAGGHFTPPAATSASIP